MKRVTTPLLLLLITVIVFYNIERVDLGQKENIINLQSFVYLLSLGAIFSTLLIHTHYRFSFAFSFGFWILLYITGKILTFPKPPGDIYIYLSINEVAFLVLLLLLSHRLAKNLYHLKETIHNFSLKNSSHRVKNMIEADDDIKKEFIRSRRKQYPLSVMALDITDNPQNVSLNLTTQEIINILARRYINNKVVHVLDRELRRTDFILVTNEENEIILLFPETNWEESHYIGSRISRHIEEALNLDVEYGIASFPEQELTFEQLVDKAKSELAAVHMQTQSIKEDIHHSTPQQ